MYGAGAVPTGAGSGDSFPIVLLNNIRGLTGFSMFLLNNTTGITKVGCGDAANGWMEQKNTRGITKVGCGDAANGWMEHAPHQQCFYWPQLSLELENALIYSC